MKCVLITGVAGQDGSFLAEQLLARGDRVVGVTLIASPDDWWQHAPRAHDIANRHALLVHEADVTDAAQFSRIVSQERPDEVYHLAAPTAVDASWSAAANTEAAIARGAESVLTACARHAPAAHVIMASSSEIFAADAPAPQNEHSPIGPASPYGKGKLIALQRAREARSRGQHVSSAILFNHESERRPPRFVTRKVTLAAARIAAGVQHSLSLGNMEARRDWGFAGDYMDALVRLATVETPEDVVVGTGEAHSVLDLVALAFAVVGLDYRDHVARDDSLTRPVDAPLRVADARRAHIVLDWTPRIRFEALVRRMVAADVERVRLTQDEGPAS